MVDLATKHALIAGGLGWGHMPEHLVRDDLRAGRLVELELEAWGRGAPRRSLVLVLAARTRAWARSPSGRRSASASSAARNVEPEGPAITRRDGSASPAPQFPAPRGAITLSGMNYHDHRSSDRPRDHALSRARSVEGIHRSTTFHWVGNGFHVSTYFPSAKLAVRAREPVRAHGLRPAEGVRAARPRQARRRLASAPRLRDRDAGLGGRGRAPRQRRPRRRDRPRRRAVDDRRLGHLPRGVPRGASSRGAAAGCT